MAKTNAPLLSLGATGTIGKTVTFGSWKGVGYARQRVTPANPRTTAQTATRNVFRSGGQSWRLLPTAAVNAWTEFVRGRPLTPRNAYIGSFTRLLRGGIDLGNWQVSPGSGGGSPPSALSVTTGVASGAIDVSWSPPEIPTGWSIVAAHAVFSLDHDPATDWTQAVGIASDLIEAGAIPITGLTPGAAYGVSVFLEWTRADGRAAFSVSQTSVVSAGA